MIGTEKHLAPVIKLSEPDTFRPWEQIPCPFVVIKLQELLSRDGSRLNWQFYEINKAGGLHNFLGYEGRVLLSSIMPDRMARGLTVPIYLECIKNLMPNYYMTPDGETYEGETSLAAKEINRMLEESKGLIRGCRTSVPFGLVKGSKLLKSSSNTAALPPLPGNTGRTSCRYCA